MSAHGFPHRRQHSPTSLQALDFGLRVRIEARSDQRQLFAGAEDLSVRQLASELAEMASRLRIHSFSLRAEIEHVTSALLVNVECGFWSLARRAALDLAVLLVQSRKRRLANADLCFRAANAAFRVADLCAKEAR
jgi:hypothetical protein